MKTTIKATQFALTPAIETYIHDKLVRTVERLTKRSNTDSVMLAIEVAKTTRHHQKGDVWRAEAMLTVEGKTFRAETSGQHLQEAIDLLEPSIGGEIKRFKDKIGTLEKRGARKVKTKLNTSKAARRPRRRAV